MGAQRSGGNEWSSCPSGRWGRKNFDFDVIADGHERMQKRGSFDSSRYSRAVLSGLGPVRETLDVAELIRGQNIRCRTSGSTRGGVLSAFVAKV
jgi:hypothetical protein